MVSKIKRAYKKPELEIVHLVSEEAVLTGCKFANFSGPGGNACRITGSFRSCRRPQRS
jgi:hypothetical protein